MACLAEGRAIAINSAAASEGFRPPFPGDGVCRAVAARGRMAPFTSAMLT